MPMFQFPRPQFRLRSLLLGILVVSLLFASVRVAGILGAYAFLFVFAIVLIAIGLWKKRRTPQFGGALLLGAVLFSCVPVTSRALWIGRGNFVVAVTVVNAENGQPISGASVSVFKRYSDTPVVTFKTDASGYAAVPTVFRTGGSSGLFEDTGYIRLWSHNIKVECDGYRQTENSLEEYTGTSCDLYAGSIPAVTVELKPNR